jgi:predicted MFS family arabinose efflux permease
LRISRSEHARNDIAGQETVSRARPAPAATAWLLAAACGVSVANVYYAQPLLDAMARDFAIATASIGGVMTATQLGCAAALLLVVPLGDLLDRRRLALAQLLLLTLALLWVAGASSRAALFAGMFAVGLLGTAMTQGLIAYTAQMASPETRGRMVGIAASGVVTGLLLARTLAGVLADLGGWRLVYYVAAGLALLLLALLAKALPRLPRPAAGLSYGQLLRSMAHLLAHGRVLQVRGVIAMLMFASFSVFWTSLVLPLSAPPYALSHSAIGAFGLAGAAGALAAARAGRLADRGLAQRTTGAALALLLASWLAIGYGSDSLWFLVLGVIALDLAGQAIHVVNQSLIFQVQPAAHSRLVGCYMLFYTVGSGLGAIASTAMYARAGWTGVCWLGAAISAAALVFWALTRPLARPRDAGHCGSVVSSETWKISRAPNSTPSWPASRTK